MTNSPGKSPLFSLCACALVLLTACGSDSAPEGAGGGAGQGSAAAGGGAGAGGSGASGASGAAGPGGGGAAGGGAAGFASCEPTASSDCADTGCAFDPLAIDCDAAVTKVLQTFCGDDSPCGKCKDMANFADDRAFLLKTCEQERIKGGEHNAMWGCNAQSPTCAERNDCYSAACKK